MARQDRGGASARQRRHRLGSAPGRACGPRFRLDQGMVAGHQPMPRGHLPERGHCARDARARQIPLGPVEPPLEPGGGPERHHRDIVQLHGALDLCLQPAKAAIRSEEPGGEVEMRQVVIAHLDRDGRGERLQPTASSLELARPGPHGEIAGNEDGVGALGLSLRHEPVERGPVLRAEMQVAGVQDQDHTTLPRQLR